MKVNKYRVWFVIIEQAFQEQKLWGHVMGKFIG